MTSGADVLRAEFADSCQTLHRVLADVGDDEFFWEPVSGCWTLHPKSESRGVNADGSGDWGACDPNEPRNRRTRSSIVIEDAQIGRASCRERV